VLDKALRTHDWASAATTAAASSRSEEGQTADASRPRRILLLDGEFPFGAGTWTRPWPM
jgi:hypothetical protein